MGACSCSSIESDIPVWSGITRIHHDSAAIAAESPLLPDGEHFSLSLNSYREESGQHLYAITLTALRIAGGDYVERTISSGYVTGAARHSTTFQGLTVTGLEPFSSISLNVGLAPETNLEVYEQLPDGTFAIEQLPTAELLYLRGRVDIWGSTQDLEDSHLLMSPTDCFIVQKRCVHDRCGPSWAHFPCRYRCIQRICGNRGPCNTPWRNAGACILC